MCQCGAPSLAPTFDAVAQGPKKARKIPYDCHMPSKKHNRPPHKAFPTNQNTTPTDIIHSTHLPYQTDLHSLNICSYFASSSRILRLIVERDKCVLFSVSFIGSLGLRLRLRTSLKSCAAVLRRGPPDLGRSD